jgi:hypothetical protein
MMLVLVAGALAGPSRCVATWTGPVEGCALRAEVVASGAGPSEKAAERALHKQLTRVVDRSVAAALARMSLADESQFRGCEDVVQAKAYVNCFEEPALASPAFCFVDLPDPTCWTGEVLQVEDVAWRALEVGRHKMCAAVDARLVAQNYTDMAARRAICAASCESKTTVRCP